MSAHLLIEHFHLLAAAPNGVKKLRELILNLAVRGKLVPQDPHDEQASELLKRIHAEKARLVVEGKKPQPQVEISEEEKPYQLPHGWEWVRLGDVTEIVRGITFPSSEKSKQPAPDRIPCLRTTNVQDTIEWADILYIRREFVGRSDQYLQRYDLVMSMANSRELVGKVALVEQKLDTDCTFGGFLGVLRPIFLHHGFLMSLLRASSTREELIDSASQTTNIANISLGKLRPLVLALPPLTEQSRIVAKVDELMVLCDKLQAQQGSQTEANARLVSTLLDTLTQSADVAAFAENWAQMAEHFDLLFDTPESIAQLKQTILQLAVQGKLVLQQANDEPASELLLKIRAKKDRLIREGKIKKDKPLPEITVEEKPYELPQGWEWVRLGVALNKITDGTHHSPPNLTSGDFKYISAKNIKPWGLDLNDMTYVTAERHHEIFSRCDPEHGDVLYIKDGATTGIATINTLSEPFSMLSSVALLKPSIGILNKYLLKTLIAPFFYEEMRAGMTGVAITRVTLSKLNNAIIPLPPLAEQSRIVAEVDELIQVCDALAEKLATSRQLTQQLMKTLTEQAA